MSISRSSPSISIEITPEMRKEKGSTIYLRVSSTDTAEFYFYSKVVDEWVSFLKPYTTYFDSLNQGEVYNYIIDERYHFNPDLNETTLRNYLFRLESSKGNGDIHLCRCENM
mgnify:CR=1 FL=1